MQLSHATIVRKRARTYTITRIRSSVHPIRAILLDDEDFTCYKRNDIVHANESAATGTKGVEIQNPTDGQNRIDGVRALSVASGSDREECSSRRKNAAASRLRLVFGNRFPAVSDRATKRKRSYLLVDEAADAAPSGLGHPARVKRHPKQLTGTRVERTIIEINACTTSASRETCTNLRDRRAS